MRPQESVLKSFELTHHSACLASLSHQLAQYMYVHSVYLVHYDARSYGRPLALLAARAGGRSLGHGREEGDRMRLARARPC